MPKIMQYFIHIQISEKSEKNCIILRKNDFFSAFLPYSVKNVTISQIQLVPLCRWPNPEPGDHWCTIMYAVALSFPFIGTKRPVANRGKLRRRWTGLSAYFWLYNVHKAIKEKQCYAEVRYPCLCVSMLCFDLY